MTGKRIYPDENNVMVYAEGDYGCNALGQWFVRPPGCDLGMLDEGHSVVEHEDGTISVSPSILVLEGNDDRVWCYHGYLLFGEWTEGSV